MYLPIITSNHRPFLAECFCILHLLSTMIINTTHVDRELFPMMQITIWSNDPQTCRRNYYYFLKYILMLSLNTDATFQTLNNRTVIRATNGRSVEAKTVFARSIHFLKDEAITVIRRSSGDDHFSPEDIQWVLTVPAIWTPGAKQFMREAAYEVIFF